MKILSVGFVLALLTLTLAASLQELEADANYDGEVIIKCGMSVIIIDNIIIIQIPEIAQVGCNICHLQAVTGPCYAYIPSWYYNVDLKKCQRFIYGGCLGNRNRFRTYRACMNRCRGE